MTVSEIRVGRRERPGPRHPFVNRDEELALIRKKLAQAAGPEKTIDSPVVCFWGAYGMGKSWLLRYIEETIGGPGKGDPNLPTIVARLDLDPYHTTGIWREEKLSRERLVYELWKQLARQIKEDPPADEREVADTIAHDFVEAVARWVGKTAPLIMLDSLDDVLRLDRDSFDWIEEYLIEPLAMLDEVVLVLASRGPLVELRRWQVRRRTSLHQLKPFDEGQAANALGADEITKPTRAVQEHAFGHPLLNDQLGTAWERARGQPLGTLIEKDNAPDPALVRRVTGPLIWELLQGLPRNANQQAALMVSILRWVGVSVTILRAFLEKVELASEQSGDAYFLDHVRTPMQIGHLLYWQGERNRYEPDPTVRRIIDHYLELDQPEKYYQAHRSAYDYHVEVVKATPQDVPRHLPECLYHGAILRRLGDSDETLAGEEWWRSLLPARNAITSSRWDQLRAAMTGDKELKELMPEHYTIVLQCIRESVQTPGSVEDRT